ncbi:Aldo/keto reductase, partial [Vararia minispora EC-137]
IPVIAFGTGSKLKGQDVTEYVENALEAGFTHLDTAQFYRTEPYVGKAIRNAGFDRSELYVTTKYSGIGTVQWAIRSSLDKLNLKSVDLYLIHGPTLIPSIPKTWAALELVKKEGLAKTIGVSNFSPKHLTQILSTASIIPAVNQIKLHPYNLKEQELTLEFCAAHGIVVEAYSSLAPITQYPGGPLDPVLARFAERIGGTPAQVIFKWVLAKGAVVVTTSTRRSRLDEYLAAPSLRTSPSFLIPFPRLSDTDWCTQLT